MNASLAWWVPYSESLCAPTWGDGIKEDDWLKSLALLINMNLPSWRLFGSSSNAIVLTIADKLWVLQDTTWINLSSPLIRVSSLTPRA